MKISFSSSTILSCGGLQGGEISSSFCPGGGGKELPAAAAEKWAAAGGGKELPVAAAEKWAAGAGGGKELPAAAAEQWAAAAGGKELPAAAAEKWAAGGGGGCEGWGQKGRLMKVLGREGESGVSRMVLGLLFRQLEGKVAKSCLSGLVR